jgi:hypothetical protein
MAGLAKLTHRLTTLERHTRQVDLQRMASRIANDLGIPVGEILMEIARIQQEAEAAGVIDLAGMVAWMAEQRGVAVDVVWAEVEQAQECLR